MTSNGWVRKDAICKQIKRARQWKPSTGKGMTARPKLTIPLPAPLAKATPKVLLALSL